jgi:hypothetical protein
VRATLNEPVPLQVLAADGRSDLFARARIHLDGAFLVEVPLPYMADGVYAVNYTPDHVGYHSIVYQLFMDAGFAVPAPYDSEAEVLDVSEDQTDLRRIMGMLHENAVYDQQVYDGARNLTAGRVRCYRDKTAALAQDPAGLLFTYQLTAAYTNGNLSFYRITREL